MAVSGARHALGLERVLLVVANQPWQKADRVVTPAPDRLAMVEAAVEGVDGVEASSMEIERGGVTYTVDTLESLVVESTELVLILGADVATELDTWERPDDVRRLASLAIVDRAGNDAPELEGWRCERVVIPRLDVSSTDLRERLAARRPCAGLAPPAVLRLIEERALYASGG